MGKELQIEAEECLTIKQVAGITEIPISTVRKYCSKYRELLELKRGRNNSLLFKKEVIQQLLKVRDWTGQGIKPKIIKNMLMGKVEHGLSKDRGVGETSVVNTDERGLTEAASFDLLTTQKRIHDMVRPLIKQELEAHTEKLDKKIMDLEAQNESLKAELQKLNEPRDLKQIVRDFLKLFN